MVAVHPDEPPQDRWLRRALDSGRDLSSGATRLGAGMTRGMLERQCQLIRLINTPRDLSA
jgi:hypothetical protein